MLNTSDYLIPIKFTALIIQTVFSVVALGARVIQFLLLKILSILFIILGIKFTNL